MPAPRPIVSARILTARTYLNRVIRRPDTSSFGLAQPPARHLAEGREGAGRRQGALAIGANCTAGHSRQGARARAAGARHACGLAEGEAAAAPDRSLCPHRLQGCSRGSLAEGIGDGEDRVWHGRQIPRRSRRSRNGMWNRWPPARPACWPKPNGPRIAALAFEGWDTHARGARAAVAAADGPLGHPLPPSSASSGPAWKDTRRDHRGHRVRPYRPHQRHRRDRSRRNRARRCSSRAAPCAAAGSNVLPIGRASGRTSLRDGRDLAGHLPFHAGGHQGHCRRPAGRLPACALGSRCFSGLRGGWRRSEV